MIFTKELSKKLLKFLLIQLEELNLFPVIGTETEFYLIPLDNTQHNPLWQASKLDIDLSIEKEKGLNQFEVRTAHTKNIFECIDNIIRLRDKITKQASNQGMTPIFNAKPFANQPGNALHIHLHLENKKGDNLFIKKQEKESELLLHSIGGLCSTMAESMLLFAPYQKAYLRYTNPSLESPSKICWGGNNRSAAIRIPLDQKFNRRFEHRVACSDSNPTEVITAIIFGLLKGIKEKIQPPEKVYGNAFLEQYDFPKLPQSYEEAQVLFHNGIINSFFINNKL